MKRVRAALLAALLAAPAAAGDPAVRVSSPTATPSPRRYRLGDTDQPRASGGWLSRIENALPVGLLIFLGLNAGNVRVSGRVGTTSVDVGAGDR